MQATSCSFLSPKLLPPAKLPPAKNIKLPAKVFRIRTSITAPQETHVSIPVTDDPETAFCDYQKLFVSQRSETAEPILLRVVDGVIPDDFPSGTYYLVGPGLFHDDHGSTVHPLDGHGYLRAFTIDGISGEVRFSARYVETEAQMEERDRETGKWRFTHRGPFSVLRGGKKLGNVKVMKNVANTTVLKWGDRLLCLWEGGDPYEIDPRTLDTVGKFEVADGGNTSPEKKFPGDVWDLAARFLKPILSGVFKMPPKRLLSHYKIDSHRNRVVVVSCNAEDMLLPRSNFTFYELDLDFKLIQKQEYIIPDQLMIHDWAITDTHYILFGNCIKTDVAGSIGAICGLTPMISALAVDPSSPTSPIYLLPRFSNKDSNATQYRDWRVPIKVPSQMWLLHVGNAFEEWDHKGNLDIQIHAVACSYQWFNFQKMFGYDWKSGKLDPTFMNGKKGEEEFLPHLFQISIKMDHDGHHQNCFMEPLNHWRKPSDFPAINPNFFGSKTKYIYAATSSGSHKLLPHFPFDTVAKLNLSDKSTSTWQAGSRCFIGEPIFIPKGVKEDEGYLLVVEYAVSIERCYLVVLDPKRFEKADCLVARLEIPKHLNFPLGFHGVWAPK